MENRKHFRTPCDLMAGCLWDESFTIDQVRNVSEGGVFLETSKPLPAKEKVSLRIFFPKIKEPLDVDGMVVWSARELPEEKTVEQQGIGIRFSFLEKEQRDRLRHFLEDEKGGA